MCWNTTAIKNYCRQLAYKLDVEFDCPIKINGRLTRTYGKTVSINTRYGWQPDRIEISRKILETATDEAIMDIIAHEFVHWYLVKTTHELHGHDGLFQEVCKKIGCGLDGPTAAVERLVEDSDIYKYEVYCPNHGIVAQYYRAGKIVKNIERYRCGECGCSLEVKQNY